MPTARSIHVTSLALALAGAARAAVVIDMPPPPRTPEPAATRPASPAPTFAAHADGAEKAPAPPPRVGDVALYRYAYARGLPRDTYGPGPYRRSAWGPYGLGSYGWYGSPYYGSACFGHAHVITIRRPHHRRFRHHGRPHRGR